MQETQQANVFSSSHQYNHFAQTRLFSLSTGLSWQGRILVSSLVACPGHYLGVAEDLNTGGITSLFYNNGNQHAIWKSPALYGQSHSWD